MGLGPEDRYNIRGADRAEPLAGGRIVADQGSGQEPVLLHAEEGSDARLDWAVC